MSLEDTGTTSTNALLRSVEQRTLGIGVVGCGHWGPNHVRVFNALPATQVEAVADPDLDRLSHVCGLYPAIRGERDYRALLEDPEIDAVVIATPTATHHEMVSAALDAGKHVLCEKPLCLNTIEAAELAALADATGLVLMVGHVFLFNAGIMKLKQLIDNDELGRIQYLSAARTNLGPIRRDVNAAYDLASHDISVFNWLLGAEPESISANGACFVQPDIEDVAFISLEYPNGVLASIETSWLNPKKVREVTVVGSRQMVTWDDLAPSTPVAIYDKGAHSVQDYGDYGEFQRLTMWDGDVRMPKVALAEPLRAQADAFVDAIRKGKVDRSDAHFAAGVVRVLETVTVSMAQGGRPMRLIED